MVEPFVISTETAADIKSVLIDVYNGYDVQDALDKILEILNIRVM